MSGPGFVEIRRRMSAPILEVFAWWTQADKLKQWMSPLGIAEADVDLRVGGAFRIVMKAGDVEIHHTGEFIEIDSPRRLVFTWVSAYTGPEPSLVTVELEPEGDSATQLHLVHSDLPAAAAESHSDGWGAMLERLAAGLALEEVGGAQWPSTS